MHIICVYWLSCIFDASELPNNGEVLHSQYVWIWTSTSGSSEWESDQLDSAWLSSKGWNHIPIIYKAAILNIYTPIPWNWICSLHMHIYIHFIEYYPLFFSPASADALETPQKSTSANLIQSHYACQGGSTPYITGWSLVIPPLRRNPYNGFVLNPYRGTPPKPPGPKPPICH